VEVSTVRGFFWLHDVASSSEALVKQSTTEFGTRWASFYFVTKSEQEFTSAGVAAFRRDEGCG